MWCPRPRIHGNPNSDRSEHHIINNATEDSFCGSGSTLIACEETSRHARLIELDPRYVDTTVIRWQKFTGHEAVLETSGRMFREVAEERSAEVQNPTLE